MNLKQIASIIFFVLALTAVTASAGVENIVTDSLIPDTVYVQDTPGSSGLNSVVPLTFVNDEPLRGIEMTLTWNLSVISLDSVSFVGSRVDYVSIKGATITSDTVVIYCFPLSDPDIPVGSGLLCKLHFSHQSSLGPLTILIDSTHVQEGASIHANFFSNIEASQFVPQFVPGELTFLGTSCCTGIRGNVNYSEDDEPDISDLTYLVEHFFAGGPAPPCLDEANTDGDAEGSIDISDITYLVDYFFRAGPAPPACQ